MSEKQQGGIIELAGPAGKAEGIRPATMGSGPFPPVAFGLAEGGFVARKGSRTPYPIDYSQVDGTA
jgi:hypothetical protein